MKCSFDVVLLFHHLLTWQGVVKYAMLISAAHAPLRAGLDDGRGKFFNLSVKDYGFGYYHEVDYWLKTAALVGASNPNPQLRLRWGVVEEAYADSVWENLGIGGRDPVVAIHPGSGSYSPARRWMPSGFAAVVDALSSDGLVPLIVAGPGEEQIAQLVMETARSRCVLLRGVPSPTHLAAFLSRCRLFVGNDSGVMHLAVASGIPVVAIFGPSNHKAWGPYDPDGSRSRIVRLDLPCSPCLYKGQSLGLRYGCGEMLCLKGILPEMVVEAARNLLQITRHGF